MFTLLKKRLNKMTIVHIHEKEQAYSKIIMNAPKARLVNVDCTPVTRIHIGQVGITYLPFGGGIFAYEINKDLGKPREDDLMIRDIGTLQQMITTINSITNETGGKS